MSVKASVSLTESQDAFARALVAEGRFASLSAVLQQGLEMLRERTLAETAEREALRALLAERLGGPFVDAAEGQARVEALMRRKRAELGLEG